jgi:hypothetical protein
MTTHRLTRCKHCNKKYAYQGSGEGCFREDNDKRYCPSCMKRINKVLKKIPIYSKKIWVETNDLTKEEFYDFQNKRLEESKNDPYKLPIVRIGAGGSIVEGSGLEMKLVDQEKIDFEIIDDKEYCCSSWKNGYKPDNITVAKEQVVKTGEILGYWEDFR